MLLKDTYQKTKYSLREMAYPAWVYPFIFIIILVLPMPFDVLLAGWLVFRIRNMMREAIGISRGNRKKQDER